MEATVPRLQLDRALQERGQSVPRVRVLERRAQQRLDLVDPFFEEALDQLVAIGEVPVDGATPTPAWWAMSLSEVARPRSANNSRAAARIRSWLRAASLRKLD